MRNFTCIALSALAFSGCLAVKTEHEVKPIEINMNINLKMDKQLEEIIAKDEKPSIRALLDKGALGIDNKAMLVPRGALSSAEFELVAEANAKRKSRLETVAAENGETYEAAAAAAAEKFVSRIPDGKGVWYQNKDGDWVQK